MLLNPNRYTILKTIPLSDTLVEYKVVVLGARRKAHQCQINVAALSK
jgi:hypothetical protein